MRVIGLTGNIASGKSTVSRLLRQLGAVVFDADLAAREALTPGASAWKAIANLDNGKYILPSGEVDRTALAARVFSDEQLRQWLNQLTHSQIRSAAEQFLAEQRKKGTRVAVLDVPLLFEAHWESLADEIWVVFVDEKTQCKRLMARDGIDEASALAKMRSQWPLADKAKLAQVVLNKTGEPDVLETLVVSAWRALLERIEGGRA